MDYTILLTLVSVPCIVAIFCAWKLHKWEAARKKLDEARKKKDSLFIDLACANFALGEATARAVKIDNPSCNGEMTEALEYVKKIKREQRKFFQEQGLNHLH